MAEWGQSKGLAAAADLTGTTVGRFLVRAKLGEGGMGQVYRADDTRLKRSVALKRISPYLRDDEHYRHRFLKEAERASNLSYEHIAGVYDVFEENGEIFIVMEYVEGETLRHRLRQPFSMPEFLSVAVQCVEALVAAHERGIAHRDLKPENIMLSPRGQVKILDFGIAKLLPQARDAAATESLHSATGGFSGTVAYAAPEALLEQDTDERADIFSLGVVFYEMLAAQHPFRVLGYTATTNRILHATPKPLGQLNPAVSPALEQVIHKMLAKDPADRYGTAAELLEDLHRLEHGEALALPERGQEVEAKPRPHWQAHFNARNGLTAVALLVVTVAVSYLVWTRWLAPPVERIPVAVLPVANRTGEPRLDRVRQALTEVLISELTGQPNIQVMPSERLLEITQGLEAQGKDLSSPEAIQAVATYSSVRFVVVPSMFTIGNMCRLQADVLNAQTGETIVSRKVERSLAGSAEDTFYAMLGGLADETQKYFKEAGRGQEYTPRPESSRPRTMAAAIYFADGKKAFALGEYAQALKHLEQAIQEDGQYAMAYAWMGRIYGLLGYDQQAREFSEKAARLIAAETPVIDAYFIEANLAEGKYDFSTAEAKYQALIGLYSDEPAWHISLADVYEKQGQYAKAIASYKEALRQDPNSIVAYQGLAVLYGLTKDREPALANAQQALNLYRALGHREGEASALLVLAEILRGKGDLAQAREQAAAALKIYQGLRNEAGVLWATKTLGDITFNQGEISAARRYWKQVISGSAELRNNRLVARSLMNIGVSYSREGELAKAVEYYQRSLEQQKIYGEYKDFPSLRDRAMALSNLGGILIEYGPDMERGLQWVKESTPIFETMGNTWWIAQNQSLLGMHATYAGRYREAIEHLEQARTLFRSIGSKERATHATYLTGRCYQAQDQYEQALTSLTAALDEARESGDSFKATDASIQLGRLQLRLGDVSQARAVLEEARQAVQENPALGELKPDFFNAAGELHREMGQTESARQNFQQASELWKDPYVSEASIEARSSLGLLEAEQGNRGRGLVLCQEAVAGARRLQHLHTLARTLINLARVHVLRGEHQKAIELLEEITVWKNLGLEFRAQALYWRGKALEGLGRTQEAKASYTAAQAALEKLRQTLTADDQKRFASRRDIRPLLP